MTKIAISLAAVLLLIVAIGYFAMRFLRADDPDEFDDRPAEPSRPGGRPGDQDWGPDSRTTATAGRPGRGARGHADAAAPYREQDQPARRHTARAASEPRSGGARSGGLDRAGSDTGGLDRAASDTPRRLPTPAASTPAASRTRAAPLGSRSAGSRSAGAGPDSSRRPAGVSAASSPAARAGPTTRSPTTTSTATAASASTPRMSTTWTPGATAPARRRARAAGPRATRRAPR